MTIRPQVVATGAVPFSKEYARSADVLAADAILDLFRNTDIAPSVVDEVYFGTAKAGSLIGQRSLRFAGMATGLPVFNTENACASSAIAFHLAHRAVSHGDIATALVVGVDRLSELGKGALPVQETEWDGAQGVTNPVVYAMRAQRYLHETGATVEDLARVSVKSRYFASRNPIAHMRKETSIEEVLSSRPVADPLTLFQCSPKSDGAVAVLLMAPDRAERLGHRGPSVLASVVTSGEFSLGPRDITRPDITARASRAAFERAGVGPEDLDVVELHDAFSIAELLYTEELGLCGDGEGAAHVREGRSSSLEDDGNTLVNPSGGLMGRGHPIGATGAAQILELTHQLTGRSGVRQKQGADVGLAHVTGGGASGFDNGACSVTIMRRNP